MRRLLPSKILAVWCIICACNQTKPTSVKDSSADYKKHWNEYNYARSLLGNKNDSAFFHFSHVANSSRDSLLVASSYTEMGILQNNAGDYYGSQESLLFSLERLNVNKEEHRVYIACVYNELGVNSNRLKNFDTAIQQFKKAIDFSNNDSVKMISINNMANAYREKKEYDQAIAIYDTILRAHGSTPRQYARTLSNLAYTQWLKNSNYNAAPELWLAMQIRKKESDDDGLLTSYRHLSEYYTRIMPDSGFFYSYKLYSSALQLKRPENELEALSKLILLSNWESSKKYFERHELLTDSIQTARNRAKNQFALIRYETEKHKADKLILQKENAEAQLRVVWQQAISIILTIGSVILFIWYRKRKQQAIREQQLRLSQKVHDKVANRVYRIISEIEHKGIPEQSILLNKLDSVYNQSRDISYDHLEKNNHDFQQSVTELLESFAGGTVRIATVGNSKELWHRITPELKEELSTVIEELMTNMKKHSSADNVVLKFMQKENSMELHYSDDGIGLSPAPIYGNGLRNTETRIKNIGGNITFDKTRPGLKILISIPIAK